MSSMKHQDNEAEELANLKIIEDSFDQVLIAPFRRIKSGLRKSMASVHNIISKSKYESSNQLYKINEEEPTNLEKEYRDTSATKLQLNQSDME